MTHERAITDSLSPEIETLNWVSNEILILSRESTGLKHLEGNSGITCCVILES